ncbi:hypothetical protein E2I00_008141, partial [Balaenoptera physalus]
MPPTPEQPSGHMEGPPASEASSWPPLPCGPSSAHPPWSGAREESCGLSPRAPPESAPRIGMAPRPGGCGQEALILSGASSLGSPWSRFQLSGGVKPGP